MDFAKTLNVLFVEDDANSREQMCKVLKFYFDKVECAKDGEEGLNKFKNDKFDIVISDISMPKMNGFEMIEHIKKINKDIHIIILSAYSEANLILEALNLNVDEYIIKPANFKLLEQKLEKVIKDIEAKKIIDNYNMLLEEELEKRTHELALKYITDDVTGLFNRHALVEELNINAKNKSLILIDIVDFSTINLIYGYEKSDELLREFGCFLKEKIKNKKVYRIESDIFAIITAKDKDEILKFANELIKECGKHKFFNIKNDKIYIEIEIAIAYKTDDLLKKARLALEEIKHHKKKKINFYNENLEIEKYKNKINKIKPKIIEAIEKGFVVPFFQPIVDNFTLDIKKFEALARIKYNDKLLIPADFIDVAESTNLITDITKIIIEKTFNIAQKNNYEFSINLSEKDLDNEYLIPFLLNCINKYNIKPQKITFEILENISSKGVECAVMKLKELKSIGFKIALDDFGTQNSNFEKILLLELDYIKIDGRFIKDILNDEKRLKIVKIIKKLAKQMGAEVIAEFVKNKEIFSLLKNLEICYSQGYYFSKPVEDINQFKKGGFYDKN